MITIHIDPVILQLGPFSISWHSIFILVGIMVAVWLSGRLVRRAGLPEARFYSLIMWAIPAGVVGARLVHVIDYWDSYAADPAAIFAFWKGGLAIWGAILGGTVAAIVFARIKKFPAAAYIDQIAPGLILAQAIGRIGDIINGEHISKTTSLPWGVVYTHPDSPGYGLAPVHPAVAYELLMDLFILGLLWKLRGRFQPDGTLFAVYLVLYSVGRFFLSFLRLDSNTVFLSLNQPQWICLLVLLIAVPVAVSRRVSWRRAQIPGNLREA